MAIDEALLRHFDPATSWPVFRLYGWHPAALSLGRFQSIGEIDTEHCRRHAIAVVRRMTGGGALFHADELTYSLVCSPEQIPATSSIKDSFRVLTAFLLAFYRSLGFMAGYAGDDMPGERGRLRRTPFCFAGRESYDILIGGRKIGGNAQRRLRQVIFQHGSIPRGDRLAEGAACLRQVPADIAGQATCLVREGRGEGEEQLGARLLDCFRHTLGVHLAEGRLLPEERATAARLLEEKYRNPAWNLDGREP